LSNRVSVVIPVYNGEAYIAEALDSVMAQNLPPHEVIVVDDGSTDQTASIVRRYNVTLIQQENRGLADTRNVAIEHASGDLIALLDADDVWTETKLGDQVEALETHPEAGYALGYHRYIFAGEARAEWFKRTNADDPEPSYCPSIWMIRREVLDRVGLFEPGRRLGEDIDWLARANDLGTTFHMVPKVLLLRRIHDNNLTGLPEMKHAWLRVLRASAARKRTMGQA
jgi:glycosyltransferase involved in cell wall biosynthesis